MARQITSKQVKLHIQLDDYNSVEDRKVKISHKMLIGLGAKKRRFKKTGKIFYFLKTDYVLTF